VEVGDVRRQLTAAIDRAKRTAQDRRARIAETEKAYDTFLQDVAVPVARMMATALKAEGLLFTVSTPGGAVRLQSDKTRDDFIEIGFDASTDPPEVIARVSRARGSRVLTDERPIKQGASPAAISEEDVLAFLLNALDPWLQR
jgi:hypothetical protein